jgi:hypothetical protein
MPSNEFESYSKIYCSCARYSGQTYNHRWVHDYIQFKLILLTVCFYIRVSLVGCLATHEPRDLHQYSCKSVQRYSRLTSEILTTSQTAVVAFQVSIYVRGLFQVEINIFCSLQFSLMQEKIATLRTRIFTNDRNTTKNCSQPSNIDS